MMGLNKDIQIELSILKALEEGADLTAAQQLNLGVTPEYARRNYDSQAARKAFHDSQFGAKKVITGPDGEMLHRSRSAAVNKYGTKRASYHQAQADHKDPLKAAHSRNKYNPFLKDQDIKKVLNRRANFQELGQHENAAKGDISEYQRGLQLRDGRRVVEGLKAQLETDVLLTGCSVKNAVGAVAAIARENTGEALKAGKETALVALTVSGLHNLAAVASGDKDLDEALKDIAVGTASSFVSGAGLKMAQEIVGGMAYIVGAEPVVNLTTGGFPSAEVAAVVMTAKYVKQYLDGEISGEDCALQILASSAGALSYQFGMVIGGPAGAAVASIITTQITNTILEYRQEKKDSRARDAEISRVLSHAKAEIARQRDLLNGYVKTELKRWDDSIDSGFRIILQSAENQDVSGVAQGLNTVLALFNTSVLYPTLEDFDRDFYNLDAPPLIL